jgi:O-succinylbenzoate synthase
MPGTSSTEEDHMQIEAVELRTVSLPLKSPFRTSFGTERVKDALLVRVVADDCEGWGECVASAEPLYSSEYLAGAMDVMRSFLLPILFGSGDVAAADVGRVLAPVKGHRMAKAALEMAVLDAELRRSDTSLARRLGGVVDRVPSGVSVGIMDSVPELLDAVGGYLDQGYVRIKLKIQPGWDVDVVEAVRERFGDIPLQVDANAAYRLSDSRRLCRLDAFDLLLVEQPLAEEDLRQHAELARLMTTPVCLDESIVSSSSAADAISLGACRVINIKAGRVGGYLEAVRIHDLAVASGIAVWCGGMVETGLGRAANVALASLPGFTLPGDVSGSDRFFAEDLTESVVMRGGYVDVPTGPGIGATPVETAMKRMTTARSTVSRHD